MKNDVGEIDFGQYVGERKTRVYLITYSQADLGIRTRMKKNFISQLFLKKNFISRESRMSILRAHLGKEGQTVCLPRPKNMFATDLCIRRENTIPFLLFSLAFLMTSVFLVSDMVNY